MTTSDDVDIIWVEGEAGTGQWPVPNPAPSHRYHDLVLRGCEEDT